MKSTEEGKRKRLQGDECQCDAVEKVELKKPRTPDRYEVVDEEGEGMMAWLTLDDETVTELSDLLDSSGPSYSSPGQPFNFKVKFIDDPYMSSVIFQSSSAYVTINGNEESCGSSFSDSDSSVMASVDMGSVRGLVRKLSGELSVDGSGGACGSDARGWLEDRDFVEGIFVKSLSGCDLFGSPSPSGYNYENDCGGGGGGEDEMWINFVTEDLFGGSC